MGVWGRSCTATKSRIRKSWHKLYKKMPCPNRDGSCQQVRPPPPFVRCLVWAGNRFHRVSGSFPADPASAPLMLSMASRSTMCSTSSSNSSCSSYGFTPLKPIAAKVWSKGNLISDRWVKPIATSFEGRNEEARALEYLVVNKSWCGHRFLIAVGKRDRDRLVRTLRARNRGPSAQTLHVQ